MWSQIYVYIYTYKYLIQRNFTSTLVSNIYRKEWMKNEVIQTWSFHKKKKKFFFLHEKFNFTLWKSFNIQFKQ